jgi:small subunit ribosomal protein S1
MRSSLRMGCFLYMAKNLVKKFALDEAALNKAVAEAMGATQAEEVTKLYESSVRDFSEGTVVKGKVMKILPSEVLVDVGYKCEGAVPAHEFDNLESLPQQAQGGSHPRLGARWSARTRKATSSKGHGAPQDQGRSARRHRRARLPAASRRSTSAAPRRSATSSARKIRVRDPQDRRERMNIVISAASSSRASARCQEAPPLSTLKEGQVRKGTVKNIADFGAFVDLGGIDGLLHITDMSWGRINHPSEMLKIDRRSRSRSSTSTARRRRSPSASSRLRGLPVGGDREEVPGRLPRHRGEVVNLMSYGAFVKLEDGIEGLVHISEMSWTRRVNHPPRWSAQDQRPVEVVVLEINKDKQEISLGMKQTEVNPWDDSSARSTPRARSSRARCATSPTTARSSRSRKASTACSTSPTCPGPRRSRTRTNASRRATVQCVVLSVDREKKRIALGVKQLTEDPWKDEIPRKYGVGDAVPDESLGPRVPFSKAFELDASWIPPRADSWNDARNEPTGTGAR